MSRCLFLVLQTKNGFVETGHRLTCDAHVDLSYRLAESGMFSSMGKKHWHFAVIDGNEARATAPLYLKEEGRNGLARYEPRIPVQKVRGSFNALLIGLELVAESSAGRKTVAADRGHSGPTELTAEIAALEKHLGENPGSDASMVEVLQTEDGPVLVEWEELPFASVQQMFGDILPGQNLPTEPEDLGRSTVVTPSLGAACEGGA